jgi:hypothetical protein
MLAISIPKVENVIFTIDITGIGHQIDASFIAFRNPLCCLI